MKTKLFFASFCLTAVGILLTITACGSTPTELPPEISPSGLENVEAARRAAVAAGADTYFPDPMSEADGMYEGLKSRQGEDISSEASALAGTYRDLEAKANARAEAEREIKIAEDLAEQARAAGADVSQADIYNRGMEELTEAKTLFSQENYADSLVKAKEAQELFRQLDLTAKSDTPPLPKYYVVRTWIRESDCLWNIAGRPYVFNDPWEWRRLYEINREKFPQPDNPDLIVPNMILEIPSLKGEQREGTYDPAQTYPTFGQ